MERPDAMSDVAVLRPPAMSDVMESSTLPMFWGTAREVEEYAMTAIKVETRMLIPDDGSEALDS
jgi:hypothetical protein